MKSSRLFKQMITLMLATSTSSTVFAKSLTEYRGAQAAAIQTQAQQNVEEILRLLNSPSVSVEGLTDAKQLATFNSTPRISFATGIKRFLDMSQGQMHFDDEYAKPTTFNPTWSVEESRGVKRQRRQDVCERVLAKFDMNKLVEDLEQKAGQAKGQGYANIAIDARQTELLAKLSSSLGGPLLQVLGKPVSLEVANGTIQEIHFSKADSKFTDANTVSLTLSLLVSIATEKDAYYIRSQNCLTRYLQEQSDILEIRKAELTSPYISQKINKVGSSIRRLFEIFEKDPSTQGQKVKWSDFYAFYVKSLSGQDATASYLDKKNKYMLGQNLDSAAEIKLIDRRVSQIKNVLPYLKEKLKGSQFANKVVSKLSAQQLNGMLAFMLKLQGANIPTDSDIQTLSKNMKSAAGGSEVETDLVRYKTTLDELTNLKFKLEELKLATKG